MPDNTVKKIGQYELRSVLGKGGMATVWRAYQTNLDREVALKLMAPQFSEDETFTKRFIQEARSIARLRHTNILSIYEFGEEARQLFIVTEMLDGGTLREFMRRPLSLKQMSRILNQVADALDYAHTQGIIHRDIKPSNVLMGTQREVGDRAVLGDFGIAKVLTNDNLTQTGQGIGTPEYMSPEQASGEPLDGRSDQYSLGIVLYEMLTGVTPFKSDTPLAVLMGHVNRALPDPRTFRPDLAPEIVAVLKKTLAKFPQERYDTTGKFADAFAEAVNNSEMKSVVIGPSDATMAISPPPRPTGTQMMSGPVGQPTTSQTRGAGPMISSAMAYDYAVQQEEQGNRQAAFETFSDIFQREPNYRDVSGRVQGYQSQNYQYTGTQTLFRRQAHLEEESGSTRAISTDQFKNPTQVGPFVPQDPTVPGARLPSGPVTVVGSGARSTASDIAPVKKSSVPLIGIGLGAAALVVAAIVAILVLAGGGSKPGTPTPQAQSVTGTASGTTVSLATTVAGTSAVATNPTTAANLSPSVAASTAATTIASKPDVAGNQVGPIVQELYKPKSTANLKDSISKLKMIAANNKDSWQAQRALGRAYYWYVREKGGLPYLQQAIALNPDDAMSHAYLAVAYFDTFDDAKALTEISKATALEPNSPEVQAAFAITLLRTDPSRAKTLAQDALKKDPDNILANWAAWASFLNTREFGTAQPYIKKLVDNYPAFASFPSGYGDHFKLQGNDDEALTWYKKALQVDPDFPLAHSGLAEISRLKGDFNTALTEYQAALKVYDIDPNAHIGLGYTFDAKGQSAEAEAEFNRALALDRSSAPAYNGLAITYISRAKNNRDKKQIFENFLTQAVAQADQAIKLVPNYPDAYFQKGQAYYLLEKYTEAEAPLKSATDLEKNNPNYFILQAYNLWKLTKKEDAKRALQEAQKFTLDAVQTKQVQDLLLLVNK